MPGVLEEDALLQLLAAPEIGVLYTVDAKGRPEGSPVWFEASAQGADKIYVHVARDSKKARNVRANPNVSASGLQQAVSQEKSEFQGSADRRAAFGMRNPSIRWRTACSRYAHESCGNFRLGQIFFRAAQ
jgi:nitroimidazol reductase NimA-like FMN-containing flavoprotein (pyridoxamine 5'-phosphate oxidase superfamily)